MIEVTKQVRFEMAHRIYGYNGLCGTIHGHSYVASATIQGLPSKDMGIVVDFSELKSSLSTITDRLLDHSLLLAANDPLAKIIEPHCSRLVLTSHPATAETISQILFNSLHITYGEALTSVAVQETATSLATARSANPDYSLVKIKV